MWSPQDIETYERYRTDLTRFATGLVGKDDAQDVVSAAVIRVLTSESWPRVANRRAYLYRAVANEARRVGANRSRQKARDAVLAVSAVGTSAPDTGIEVASAVGGLSVRQRAVVYLTYWEQCRPQEIAELLGVSAGSVKRHLARARAHLRRTLQ